MIIFKTSLEREGKGIKTESRCTPSFRSLFHCCFASNPLSSSSMVYSVTQEDIPNDGLSIVSNDAAESLQFNQLCTNTSHNLWDEHLVANPAMPEKQNCISYMSSEDATCASVSSIENSDKDIPQVSVNRLSLSIQAGFPGVKQTKHWQKQLDSRTRAVQVADIGTRKCKIFYNTLILRMLYVGLGTRRVARGSVGLRCPLRS